MRTFCALCFCVVLAATTAAAQQTTPGSQSFRTGVEAVELDVRVLDDQGRPVDGLTASDFDVYEDGVRQDVRVFTPVRVPVMPRPRTGIRVEPDTQSNREPFNGRLYVFVLDDLHTHPLRSQRVKALVRQFIDRHFAANDRAAIVTTSGRPETAQELTSSAKALLDAADHFVGRALASSTLERIAEYYRQQQVSVSSEDNNTRAVKINDPLDAERAYQARRALTSLRDVARWLDSVPARRKALVYVSEGIDYDLTDLVGKTFTSGLLADVQEAIAAAARSNTTIYTVDPRGLAGIEEETIELGSLPDETTGLGTSAFHRALRWTQDNLRLFAEQTGGFAIVNTNDLEGGFDRLVKENSDYYVLGYQPTNTRRDGRFRRVEVRLKRPDLRAVTRRGYFVPKDRPVQHIPPMRALLDSPLPVTGLPIDSTVAIFRGAKGKASVLATVEMGPGVTLTEDNGAHRGRVELLVVAVDMDGKIVASEDPAITLNLRPQTREMVSAYGLRTTARLDNIKPGKYQLRIAARDPASGKAGTVLHDLVVPDFTKLPLAVSDILLGSRGATRVTTTNVDAILKDVLDVPPTAMREFDRADSMTVFAEVYNNRPQNDSMSITTAVENEAGTVVFRTEERIDAFAFDPERHSWRHRVSIPLADISPGRYVLKMTAQPLGGPAAPVVREVAFTVRPDAVQTH
jgi:VWFA-related protein